MDEVKTQFNPINLIDWGKPNLEAYRKSSFRKSNWNSIENRRRILNNIQLKFDIKEPRDWGKITVKEIRKHGGVSLLSNYYNNSLFSCLQATYPGIPRTVVTLDVAWKREWFPALPTFPKAHWNSVENRRKFLDKVKVKHNITEPNDWGKLTTRDIKKAGGISLLKKYKGSLFACLQSVYNG